MFPLSKFCPAAHLENSLSAFRAGFDILTIPQENRLSLRPWLFLKKRKKILRIRIALPLQK